MTSQHSPELVDKFTANIVLDIVFTLITFGIYYIWIQRRQIKAANYLLKKEKYSFWRWFFLTLLTFGIYHIYFEYMQSKDFKEMGLISENEMLIAVICAIFGMTIIADVVIQLSINKHFGFESV